MRRLKDLWGEWLGQLAFILILLLSLLKWPIPTAIFVFVICIGMFHRRFLGIITEVIGQLNSSVEEAVRGMKGFAFKTWEVARRFFRHKQDTPPDKMRGFFASFTDPIDLKPTYFIGAVLLTALAAVLIFTDIFISLQTLYGMMGVEIPRTLRENPIFSSFEMMSGAMLASSGILFGLYFLDLVGFIPILPVHQLPAGTRRVLLYVSIIGVAASLAVSGLLAAYRGKLVEWELVEMSDTNLLTPSNWTPFAVLMGISLLATTGSILAFYGPVVLLIFIASGLLFLTGGLVFLSSLIIRLAHRIILLLMGIGYRVSIIISRITRMAARPFIKLFHIHGVDEDEEPEEIIDEEKEIESDEEATVPQPSTAAEVEDEEGSLFAPADAEWNPLEGGYEDE